MHRLQWRFVLGTFMVLTLVFALGCGGGDEQSANLDASRGTPRPDPHPRPAGAQVVSHASGIYG